MFNKLLVFSFFILFCEHSKGHVNRTQVLTVPATNFLSFLYEIFYYNQFYGYCRNGNHRNYTKYCENVIILVGTLTPKKANCQYKFEIAIMANIHSITEFDKINIFPKILLKSFN